MFVRHYFKDFPQLAEQTNYLEEYIELLECQLDIEVICYSSRNGDLEKGMKGCIYLSPNHL